MILLDTHVIVWLALEPNKISKAARSAIEDSRRQNQALAVSDISLLEITNLQRKGRILVNVTLETFLSEIEARFLVLPISGRICVRSLSLPAAYPTDPTDRIIGATALVESVPLLTADSDIRHSKAVRTIW